jgi:hypothetical protein
MGYSSQFFIDSIMFKHAFIKFPLMKIKIWNYFLRKWLSWEQCEEDNGLNSGECRIAKCTWKKKYKVIISLEFNGENWVKLSIHISKANNYWWKGPMDLMAQFTISPKEVVWIIAFMGIMYVCNNYFVGSIYHARNIVMHPQKWAKVWYSYILRSCEVHYKNIFQYLDHLMGVQFPSFE